MLVSKAYFVQGFIFLLLTLALFVLAAAGFERENVLTYARGTFRAYDGVPSEIEVFWHFFPFMFVWSGLGVVIGLAQRYSALPLPVKAMAAGLFGIGVLTFVFEYYFNVFRLSRVIVSELASTENPMTWTVFLGGIALMAALTLNVFGVARFSGHQAIPIHKTNRKDGE